MGLKLRLGLFYGVSASQVTDCYREFYKKRGQTLVDEGDEFYQFTIREQDNDWTVVELDSGWEWEVRRQTQIFVSHQLRCPGFLIFVYDGDYWGYEFFNDGVVLDHFVQDEEIETGIPWTWFQASCEGDASVIAAHLPGVRKTEVTPYLVRDPLWLAETAIETCEREASEARGVIGLSELTWQAREVEHRKLNVPARMGDEFCRFDECAVLDFLRMLKIRVELRERYVTFLAPEHRSFWISQQNTHKLHDLLYKL